MSTFLSPVKLAKDSTRFSSRSLRNLKLQGALDEAGNYSDLVNLHLIRARQENHVLATAVEAYKERGVSHQSHSSFVKMGSTRTKRIYSNKTLKNPELPNMIRPISSKAEFIPSIRQLFQQSLQEKMALEQRMKQLKTLIGQERKRKDRLYITNCRHINALEQAQKHIKNNRDQSQKDNILIKQTNADVRNLEADLNSIAKQNRKTLKRIEEERVIVDNLSKEVQQKKIHLENESQELSHLKFIQSVAYRNMNNDYLLLNQRKESKALFLNHIHMDVARNS